MPFTHNTFEPIYQKLPVGEVEGTTSSEYVPRASHPSARSKLHRKINVQGRQVAS